MCARNLTIVYLSAYKDGANPSCPPRCPLTPCHNSRLDLLRFLNKAHDLIERSKWGDGRFLEADYGGQMTRLAQQGLEVVDSEPSLRHLVRDSGKERRRVMAAEAFHTGGVTPSLFLCFNLDQPSSSSSSSSLSRERVPDISSWAS